MATNIYEKWVYVVFSHFNIFDQLFTSEIFSSNKKFLQLLWSIWLVFAFVTSFHIHCHDAFLAYNTWGAEPKASVLILQLLCGLLLCLYMKKDESH